MRHRSLGSCGLQISELSLGTWGLSGDPYGAVPEATRAQVCERALALGITWFETADSYAHGDVEHLLGRLFASETRLRIATKIGTDLDSVPPRKRFDRAFLHARFEASQDRLGRQRLDLLLLHNPSLLALQRDDAVELLSELKAQGRIAAWGVSAGSAAVARCAAERGADVVQLAYNALHRSPLEDLAGLLRAKGCGILAHSVLAYGLLCGLWPPDKEFKFGDHRAERWSSDELRRRLQQLVALRPALRGEIATLRAVALRFVLSSDLVSSAVIGPRSTLQLDQLVREAGTPPYLPSEVRSGLVGRLAALEALE